MDNHEIRKGVPFSPVRKRTGLTQTIRKMDIDDSIVLPGNKLSSVHACAAQGGARVKTQKNEDGTITVWKIGSDQPAAAATNLTSVSSQLATAPSGAPHGAAASVARVKEPTTSSHLQSFLTPDGELPTGHYETPEYGPSVWINDVDGQGRPVNKNRKSERLSELFS